MTMLSVRHVTEYRYRRPVRLGEHRLMSRPRDSHDLRLLETGLTVDPAPKEVRWIHDVFGNSIALIQFDATTEVLTFESTFLARHYPITETTVWLEPFASSLPFEYRDEDRLDLAPSLQREYSDPDGQVSAWAARHLAERPGPTLETLIAMTKAVRHEFKYQRREEMGVQPPLETMRLGSGSCRDFALFMMEAVRSIGLAAHFVSGYLYDANLIGAESGLVGGGSTHAWLQVFLPGAGWLEFDPTNALIGGRNLIRVAVARRPSQAAPLTGSYIGPRDAQLSMRVRVDVTAA